MIHAVDWMPTVLSAAGGTPGTSNTHVTRDAKTDHNLRWLTTP